MQPLPERTFHFEQCLGVGGFGEVYLATAQAVSGLRRQVAVKLLHGDSALGLDAVQRLRDEGRLLAALNHPNILAVDDLVMLDGRWGLVTEYVPGQDLSTVLEERGSLTPKVALHVAYEVADALDAGWNTPHPETGQPLHLIHRDIKPANIRLARAGVTKLLDYGIAIGEGQREARTRQGMIVGTISYMAPERFFEGAEGPAGDVYSLGCVLFEMLTGRKLVGDLATPHLIALMTDPGSHRDHIEQSLSLLDRSFPPGTQALLAAMLATDPAYRPAIAQLVPWLEKVFSAGEGGCLRGWARERHWPQPDAAEGAFVGRSLATETPTLEPPHPAPEPPPAPEPRAKRWLWMGLALVAVFALMAVLILACGGMLGASYVALG